MKYVYPNLPNFIDVSTVDKYQPQYVAEVKKNGWRCMAWKENGELKLWTRRKTIIPDPLPKTRDLLMALPDKTILDGELLEKRTKDIKDHYYVFDVMFIEDKSQLHLPYWKRREALEKLVAQYGIWVELAEPIQLGFSAYYKLAVERGDEGIVIKHLNSPYIVDLKSCPHNPQWFKAKRPENCFVNKGR